MGIKFLCPNGHRLNVKAFLAGKKAVCPKCGEKVLVPTESDPKANKPKRDTGALAEQAQPEIAAEIAMNSDPASAPTSFPAAASIATQQVAAPVTIGPGVDPFSEAPTAVWYVRPPSGGQYGPAPSDVMRGWLAEGRVNSDSLVWRSDWPDWRSASVTFPQLAGQPTPAPIPQIAGGPTSVLVSPAPYGTVAQPMQVPVSPVVFAQTSVMAPVVPAGLPVGQVVELPTYGKPSASQYEDSVARSTRRRQKAADSTMIVSGVLVALVVILFVILGVVLSQNSEEPAVPAPHQHKARSPATTVAEPNSDARRKASPRSEVQPLDDAAADTVDSAEEEMADQ